MVLNNVEIKQLQEFRDQLHAEAPGSVFYRQFAKDNLLWTECPKSILDLVHYDHNTHALDQLLVEWGLEEHVEKLDESDDLAEYTLDCEGTVADIVGFIDISTFKTAGFHDDALSLIRACLARWLNLEFVFTRQGADIYLEHAVQHLTQCNRATMIDGYEELYAIDLWCLSQRIYDNFGYVSNTALPATFAKVRNDYCNELDELWLRICPEYVAERQRSFAALETWYSVALDSKGQWDYDAETAAPIGDTESDSDHELEYTFLPIPSPMPPNDPPLLLFQMQHFVLIQTAKFTIKMTPQTSTREINVKSSSPLPRPPRNQHEDKLFIPLQNRSDSFMECKDTLSNNQFTTIKLFHAALPQPHESKGDDDWFLSPNTNAESNTMNHKYNSEISWDPESQIANMNGGKRKLTALLNGQPSQRIGHPATTTISREESPLHEDKWDLGPPDDCLLPLVGHPPTTSICKELKYRNRDINKGFEWDPGPLYKAQNLSGLYIVNLPRLGGGSIGVDYLWDPGPAVEADPGPGFIALRSKSAPTIYGNHYLFKECKDDIPQIVLPKLDESGGSPGGDSWDPGPNTKVETMKQMIRESREEIGAPGPQSTKRNDGHSIYVILLRNGFDSEGKHKITVLLNGQPSRRGDEKVNEREPESVRGDAIGCIKRTVKPKVGCQGLFDAMKLSAERLEPDPKRVMFGPDCVRLGRRFEPTRLPDSSCDLRPMECVLGALPTIYTLTRNQVKYHDGNIMDASDIKGLEWDPGPMYEPQNLSGVCIVNVIQPHPLTTRSHLLRHVDGNSIGVDHLWDPGPALALRFLAGVEWDPGDRIDGGIGLRFIPFQYNIYTASCAVVLSTYIAPKLLLLSYRMELSTPALQMNVCGHLDVWICGSVYYFQNDMGITWCAVFSRVSTHLAPGLALYPMELTTADPIPTEFGGCSLDGGEALCDCDYCPNDMNITWSAVFSRVYAQLAPGSVSYSMELSTCDPVQTKLCDYRVAGGDAMVVCGYFSVWIREPVVLNASSHINLCTISSYECSVGYLEMDMCAVIFLNFQDAPCSINEYVTALFGDIHHSIGTSEQMINIRYLETYPVSIIASIIWRRRIVNICLN